MIEQAKSRNLATVVLFGRANVGKSTLFNKFTDKKKALVSAIAGTTRDINESVVTWNHASFDLIDTGGIDAIVPKKQLKDMAPVENEAFALDIIKKSQQALGGADLILFVCDGKSGLMPADMELARHLKKMNKPIILLVNKIDRFGHESIAAEFYKLGIEPLMPISGLRGTGLGDVLDLIAETVKKLAPNLKELDESLYIPDLRISIVGRANVGKSSLFNKLIREEKAIVSPIAHTTRESKDTLISYGDKKLLFVDTAGLKKSSRIEEGLEEDSMDKTIEAVKNSEFALFVIDINEPVTMQDKKIAAMLVEHDINILVVINKWDLKSSKSTMSAKEVTEEFYYQFPFLYWAPLVFVSAKTGKGVDTIYEKLLHINKQRYLQFEEKELEKFMRSAIKRQRPITDRGIIAPRIIDFTQRTTNPPRFIVQIRPTDRLSESYVRYLENQMRQRYDLHGTKIWISIKK